MKLEKSSGGKTSNALQVDDSTREVVCSVTVTAQARQIDVNVSC